MSLPSLSTPLTLSPRLTPPSVDKLRPISLTNHFAKIAEGFIVQWVLQDITPKLDPCQFGNRKILSTNHYLINMLHLLYEHGDKPKSTSTVIVTDFTKAFDRIDHTLAITKLIDLDVRSSIIPWIADFLTARNNVFDTIQHVLIGRLYMQVSHKEQN